jgi:hypothetical protein
VGVSVVPVLADAGLVAPLLIGLVGSGGLIGAVVGFLRLRPETATAAMAQAQGANEVLQETLAAVERDRDYWKRLYRDCERARRGRAPTQEGGK